MRATTSTPYLAPVDPSVRKPFRKDLSISDLTLTVATAVLLVDAVVPFQRRNA